MQAIALSCLGVTLCTHRAHCCIVAGPAAPCFQPVHSTHLHQMLKLHLNIVSLKEKKTKKQPTHEGHVSKGKSSLEL